MKFSWKIFLCVITIVCLAFSLGGCFLISAQFHIAIQREEENTWLENQGISRSLQKVLSKLPFESIAGRQPVLFRVIADQLDKYGSEVSVMIRGRDGKLLYSTDGSNGESGETVFRPAGGGADGSGQIILEKQGQYYIHTLDHVTVHDQQFSIESRRDLTELFDSKEQQYRSFAWLLLGIVLFTGVLAGLAAAVLTKPIRRLTDITRKMAEGCYEVRAAVGQKDEIGILSVNFNEMAARLEEKIRQMEDTVRRQEEFIGSFAHEVKTPLTSVMGFADVLRSRELPEEKRMVAANHIFQESKRLEKLSMELLTLLSAENEELMRTPVRIGLLLTDIAEFVRPGLEQKKIVLHVEVQPAWLDINIPLFRTFMLNLINNAACAIIDGGEIGLCGVRLSDRYQLILTDTGRGIPREELDRITDPFYRVDKARSRKEGSFGLGLTLCGRILKLHGGTWSFESEEGRGTRITIWLGGARDEEA